MTVSLLAGRPSRVFIDALSSLGWEGDLISTGAQGLEPLAFLVDDVMDETQEALLRTAPKYGCEVVTGAGRVVVAGTRARLSALCSKPWTLPPELTDFVVRLGQALPGDEVDRWQTARGPISVDRPVIMGILNVTPDSFSDGGRFDSCDAAVSAALGLFDAGASIVDIGGESTRPGRPVPVSTEEELSRILPVIERLVERRPEALISIDTVKSEVARRAVAAGAAIINDVSGGRLDPGMFDVARDTGAGLVLMHSRGPTTTMATYDHATYSGPVDATVRDELAIQLGAAVAMGVSPDAIVLDPGLGFGKTPPQSRAALRGLGTLRALGRPLLVGPSRKRFVGELTGQPIDGRDIGSAAACAYAWIQGARIFRVHAPAVARDILSVMVGLDSNP